MPKIPKTSSEGKSDLDRALDAVDRRDMRDALGWLYDRDDDPFASTIEERREAFAKYAEIDRPHCQPRQRRRDPPAFPPGGLSRIEAARYVGVSPNTFDQMIRDGVMPEPIRYGRRKLWLRPALDAALAKLAGMPVPAMPTPPATDDDQPSPWSRVQ